MVVGLLAMLGGSAGAVTYAVQNLGTLGGDSSQAQEVNDSGLVAGFSWTVGDECHAFLYTDLNGDGVTDPGEMQDLGLLGALPPSQAYGINSAGQVVGYSCKSAFLWEEGTGMRDLGTLGGPDAYAYDINDSGQVIGYSHNGAANHAFLYTDLNGDGVTDPGEMQDLGDLGGTPSKAYGINNLGQVAGYSSTGAVDRAFLYEDLDNDGVADPGEMQDLGTLGGLKSRAYGVNDAGEVVGYSCIADGRKHAFFRGAGGMLDLDCNDSPESGAESINASGDVVGYSLVAGQQHAFLWENGAMTDLNSLIAPDSGWVLNYALDINDDGQIVGKGLLGGETRAFLLTPQAPIPEPISMIFFGTGVVGVLGYVSRKRIRKG